MFIAELGMKLSSFSKPEGHAIYNTNTCMVVANLNKILSS